MSKENMKVAIEAHETFVSVEVQNTPVDLLTAARRTVGDRFSRQFQSALAEIADKAPFRKVAAMEARRDAAEQAIHAANLRIEEIQAECAADVPDDAAMAGAAGEIEECQSATRTAQLTIASIDKAWSEAVAARDELVSKTAPIICERWRAKARKVLETAASQYWANCQSHISVLIVAELQQQCVNELKGVNASRIKYLAEEVAELKASGAA